MNNLVSILIPAYNVQSFIRQCLTSVIGQTYENLQVVIIDDGSTDGTLTVCKELEKTDCRIEVYHQENQGVAATRNKLLSKVKGEYVLFVDGDDWIELDMVEYLVNLAIENLAEVVMCDRVINDAKPIVSQPNIKILSQNEAIKDFLFHDYFVGSLCNKLIKASLLKDKSFKKEISYGEDALFVWNVLQDVDTVVVTTKQLYHYRMNETSISHQSFGEKKMTGHLTWQIITGDVRRLWPQYLDVALGTFALQDMYLLRSASQSRYPKNEKILELQNTAKTYLYKAYLTRQIGIKERVYGYMICRLYFWGRIYYTLYKLNMFRK